MLAAFQQLLSVQYNWFNDKNLFVAVSGGKDSMALLNLLLESKIPVTVLHCNFKLRIPDAYLDEEFVRLFSNEHKIPFFSTQFDTQNSAIEMNLTIQETARSLRYNWFKSFLKSDKDILLTAHHLDDNIETFLINLLRGTALNGLCGMPENKNQIIRPLLGFTKSQIERYSIDQNIKFRQDQSNFNEKYLRNKLRISILPQLKKLSSSFDLKIQSTINTVKEANNWIANQANLFLSKHLTINEDQSALDRELLKSQEPIFIEYLLAKYGVHRSNRGEFIHFLSTKTGATFHTSNYTFISNRSEIIFTPIALEQAKTETSTITNTPSTKLINKTIFSFEQVKSIPEKFSENTHYFDLDKIQFPLQIRKWSKGDKIVPLGMNGSKLISDVLINKKVSLLAKKNVHVLTDKNNAVLSILTIISSDLTKITPQTISILKVTWTF